MRALLLCLHLRRMARHIARATLASSGRAAPGRKRRRGGALELAPTTPARPFPRLPAPATPPRPGSLARPASTKHSGRPQAESRPEQAPSSAQRPAGPAAGGHPRGGAVPALPRRPRARLRRCRRCRRCRSSRARPRGVPKRSPRRRCCHVATRTTRSAGRRCAAQGARCLWQALPRPLYSTARALLTCHRPLRAPSTACCTHADCATRCLCSSPWCWPSTASGQHRRWPRGATGWGASAPASRSCCCSA